MIQLAAAGLALASLLGHHHRSPLDPPPTRTALASWYDQSGVGACGVEAQAGDRFASLFLDCGTHVRFCYRGCVVGTMADHGPYVTGRTFDLNANLRAALGCPDLCTVRWEVAR